jgi:hypothetical protein
MGLAFATDVSRRSLAGTGATRNSSDVRYQPGKAFVHVVLMMAMEKRGAWVLCHKIDLHRGIAGRLRVSLITP